MELLNLVLFGDVRKLLQEAVEVTEETLKTKPVNVTCHCPEDKRTAGRVSRARRVSVGVLLEAVRCEEVEQVKQLFQVVLQGSSCQQQLVVDFVVVQAPEKLQRRETTNLR